MVIMTDKFFLTISFPLVPNTGTSLVYSSSDASSALVCDFVDVFSFVSVVELMYNMVLQIIVTLSRMVMHININCLLSHVNTCQLIY